jgi:hypothetical protein
MCTLVQGGTDMLCYKDMTFCTYGVLCKDSGSCHRVLTTEVQCAADKWWGRAGAPIMVYADFPSCFVPFFAPSDK